MQSNALERSVKRAPNLSPLSIASLSIFKDLLKS